MAVKEVEKEEICFSGEEVCLAEELEEGHS